VTLPSAPCNATRKPGCPLATCAFGAGAATRTRNLLFRRSERTVRPGLTSSVLAGQVRESSPASHQRLGLVTAGGMTKGTTDADPLCLGPRGRMRPVPDRQTTRFQPTSPGGPGCVPYLDGWGNWHLTFGLTPT
jgi:hypothetical protein